MQSLRHASSGLLAILVGLQGLATMAIDLRRTHATNSNWPGHARFHIVWQTFSTALFAVVTEFLLLASVLPPATRFYVGALLTAVPMLSFLGALAARSVFGATLHDQNGSQPLVLHLWGSRRQFDLNLLAVILGLSALGVLCWLHTGQS